MSNETGVHKRELGQLGSLLPELYNGGSDKVTGGGSYFSINKIITRF